MTGLVSVDEALNSAFRLAYFLQADRMTAILLTVSAMNKLTVAAAAQNKRLYYIPTGRPALRAARTKIYLTELHLLQRLVYLESEPFERLKESRIGALHEDDLVVHFLKYLVRVTTRRNSFYVTVGLSRVLHDYSTPETKEIYSVIVQDPERFKDDFYYRSRKKQLMEEIRSRFGKQVEVLRGARGEERFQAQATSAALLHLVNESLTRFTPWATTCVLPAAFEPRRNMTNSLAFNGKNPDEEHQVEINRLHTLLHPDCFSRLVTGLGYDVPERRLTVPAFLSSDAQGPRQDRFAKAELTETELQAIKESLREGAGGRKKTSGNQLLVRVDGVERVHFDPARARQIELVVTEGADVIEAYSLDADGEVLLAIHLLAYDESGIQPAQSSVVLEGGQKVSFTVRPSDEAAGVLVVVGYSEMSPFRAAPLLWRTLKVMVADGATTKGWREVGMLKPALLCLLVVIGLFGLLRYRHSNDGANQPAAIAQKETAQSRASESPSPAPTSSEKTSNEQVAKPPSPKPSRRPLAAEKNIVGDTGTTRSPRTRQAITSLLSVRQVYVDPFGDDPLGQQLREQLIRGLQSMGRFVVVQNRDEAKAVLKGSLHKTSTTNTAGVSIVVRMVSADGQVVWPATSVVGKKYVGTVDGVATQIINDLQAAIRQSERKQ